MTTHLRRIAATGISERTAAALSIAQTGKIGVLYSVFSRACNVLLDAGPLIALHCQDAFLTPLSIELEGDTLASLGLCLRTGDPVFMDGQSLCLGGAHIQLKGAAFIRCRQDMLGPCARDACAVAAAACQPLLPPIPVDTALHAVYRRCIQATLRIRAALEAADQQSAICAAKDMIGLGPGLTPSGDDMLCGFIAASTLRGLPVPEAFGSAMLTLAEKTSTRVSLEFFRCLLKGYYLPTVNDLLFAARAGNIPACIKAAQRLVGMGSSSGGDYLLGIYLAVEQTPQFERI